MVRVRVPSVPLASLALAASVLFLSGCATSWSMWQPGSLLGRHCHDCEEVAMSTPSCATGACPGGPLLSNGRSTVIEGPPLFPPSPTPFGPAVTTMPPTNNVPRPNPLPSIVTIPQANPTPSPP